MNTALINHSTATQIASVYQRNTTSIIDKLRQIAELRAELKECFLGVGDFDFDVSSSDISRSEYFEKLQTEFKRTAWRTLIDKLGIRKFMSAKKIKQLDSAVVYGAKHGESDGIDEFPEIHEETILDVLMGYMKSTDDFLDELIAEEWDYWLPQGDEYKTNKEKWKVSAKVIKGWVMRPWDQWDKTHRPRYDAESHLRNLNNIFRLLDGEGFSQSHRGELGDALYDCESGKGETEYFRFKCFKNGNLHLWFKRDDLLATFNRIGCGEGRGLPNPPDKAAKANPLNQPIDRTGFDLGQFDSTDDVIDAIESKVKDHYGADKIIDDGSLNLHRMKGLEPSAGIGNIAYRMRDWGMNVFCYEIDRERAKRLDRAFNFSDVDNSDFLTSSPSPALDVVCMNPPFNRNQAIHHVYHAFKFVKKGGVLVAVMPPSWMTNQDRLSLAFREWVASVGGEWEPLPDSSFKQSGTNVNCGLLTISRKMELENVQPKYSELVAP